MVPFQGPQRPSRAEPGQGGFSLGTSQVPGLSSPCSPWLFSRRYYKETSGLMNTEVGRLSLLQGIFPTQELKPGLLHCRWILYQLSYSLQNP